MDLECIQRKVVPSRYMVLDYFLKVLRLRTESELVLRTESELVKPSFTNSHITNHDSKICYIVSLWEPVVTLQMPI